MFELKKYHYYGIFLSLEVTILAATILKSHISEHILIAAGIGWFSIILFMTLTNKPIFTLGWYTGTLYYLGREVRDFEKKTGGSSTGYVDIGGILGPFLGNMITFYVSYLFYKEITQIKIKTSEKKDIRITII